LVQSERLGIHRPRILRQLSLFGTQVTDAGLLYLEALKRLSTIDLTRTQVTAHGVADAIFGDTDRP